MAVTSGSKILDGDLAALALAANNKVGTGRLSNVVSPMYNDGSGNQFGFYQGGNIAIVPTARGTGYKIGDTLVGFGSDDICSLTVEAVDPNGGLIGLRIASLFANPWTATPSTTFPSSPASISGAFGGANTSGSGAQATFTMGQVGPGSNYTFQDVAINQGTVTSFVLASGGAGYQVGDVLTMPGLPTITAFGTVYAPTVAVSSVNGSGAITGITQGNYASASISIPVPNVTSLSGNGGHGNNAIFYGLFTLQMRPAWATELGRLRTNLETYLGALEYPANQLSISGPWPIGGPEWYNHDQWFWYEDTGGTVTMTVSATYQFSSSGPFGTQEVFENLSQTFNGDGWGNIDPSGTFYDWFTPTTPNASLPRLASSYANYNEYAYEPPAGGESGDTQWWLPNADVYDCLYCTQKSWSVIIGGSLPVTLEGTFYLIFQVNVGFTRVIHYHGSGSGSTSSDVATKDSTDPRTLVTIGGNFPGTYSAHWVNSASIYDPNYPTYLVLAWAVNQTINPGTYTIDVAFNNQGEDSTTIVQFQARKTDTNPDSPTYGNQIPDTTTYDSLYTRNVHTRLAGYQVSGSGLGPDSSVLNGAAVLTWGTPSGGYDVISALSGNPTISLTFSNPIAADGIDGDKNVFKMQLPDYAADVGGQLPVGIYTVNYLCVDPPGTALVLPPTYPPGPIDSPPYGPYFNAPGVMPSQLWQYDYFPQPFFNVIKIAPGGSWGVTTSTPGLWTGITAAVSNLNVPAVANMPWNFLRTQGLTNPMLPGSGYPNGINSYPSAVPIESQMEPPSWRASTAFQSGFTILSPDGSAILQCSHTGISGTQMPDWNESAVGAITDEPQNPEDVLNFPGTVWAVWTVLKLFKPHQTIQPAQHRARPIPRYPVYWFSETVAALKPPATSSLSELTIWGAGGQWQDYVYEPSTGGPSVTQHGFQQSNLARGWWIYSVSFNRMQQVPANIKGPGIVGMGSTTVGMGDPDTGMGGGSGGVTAISNQPVAVTIGCIRNGTFVAFAGNYVTGQTYNVLWPVFTSDALVYQASERIDVQAVAIGMGGNGVSTGLGAVNHPIAAAFVTDVETLLGFVI